MTAAVPRAHWTGAALLAADAAALTIATLATVALARYLDAGSQPTPWLPYMAVTLFAPVAFATSGLYPAAGLGPVQEYRRLGRALLALAGACLLVGSVVWGGHALAAPLIGWVGLGLATVPACRALAREFLARRDWWGVPVAVLGDGPSVEAAIVGLQDNPGLGLRPIACLIEGTDERPHRIRGVPVTSLAAAPPTDEHRGRRPHLLVLPRSAPTPAERRFDLGHMADGAFVMTSTVESLGLTGVTPVARERALDQRHAAVDRPLPAHGAVKRALDVLLAIPLAVVASPLIVVAALAIVIVSPGTPFYWQERTGLGGRPIRVWKLRTMYTDAAARLARHLADDPEAEREWSRTFKLTRDPRILPMVGSFLRASSIDELPQVFNVLRGDMSFVGPRPFPEYHLAAFDADFRQLRTTVRPGITGLWQVTVRSDGDLEDQRVLDTAYIQNWSLALDLYLLARTPLAVLSTRGAR